MWLAYSHCQDKSASGLIFLFWKSSGVAFFPVFCILLNKERSTDHVTSIFMMPRQICIRWYIIFLFWKSNCVAFFSVFCILLNKERSTDHVTSIFMTPRQICIRWYIISFLGNSGHSGLFRPEHTSHCSGRFRGFRGQKMIQNCTLQWDAHSKTGLRIPAGICGGV